MHPQISQIAADLKTESGEEVYQEAKKAGNQERKGRCGCRRLVTPDWQLALTLPYQKRARCA